MSDKTNAKASAWVEIRFLGELIISAPESLLEGEVGQVELQWEDPPDRCLEEVLEFKPLKPTDFFLSPTSSKYEWDASGASGRSF